MNATHKDVSKKCVAERHMEVAFTIEQNEGFQCVKSTTSAEHLKGSREESSDIRNRCNMQIDDQRLCICIT